MSRVSGTVTLEIDRLVFDGLSRHEARQAAASFETTLSGLITAHGLRRSWQSTAPVDLDLEGFDGAGGRPHILGEALARFLYERADR